MKPSNLNARRALAAGKLGFVACGTCQRVYSVAYPPGAGVRRYPPRLTVACPTCRTEIDVIDPLWRNRLEHEAAREPDIVLDAPDPTNTDTEDDARPDCGNSEPDPEAAERRRRAEAHKRAECWRCGGSLTEDILARSSRRRGALCHECRSAAVRDRAKAAAS